MRFRLAEAKTHIKIPNELLNNPSDVPLKDITRDSLEKQKELEEKLEQERVFNEIQDLVRNIEDRDEKYNLIYDKLVSHSYSTPSTTLLGELFTAYNQLDWQYESNGYIFWRDIDNNQFASVAAAFLMKNSELEQLLLSYELDDNAFAYETMLNQIENELLSNYVYDINYYAKNDKKFIDTSTREIIRNAPTYVFTAIVESKDIITKEDVEQLMKDSFYLDNNQYSVIEDTYGDIYVEVRDISYELNDELSDFFDSIDMEEIEERHKDDVTNEREISLEEDINKLTEAYRDLSYDEAKFIKNYTAIRPLMEVTPKEFGIYIQDYLYDCGCYTRFDTVDKIQEVINELEYYKGIIEKLSK